MARRTFAGWGDREGIRTSTLTVCPFQLGRTRTRRPAARSAAISGSAWNDTTIYPGWYQGRATHIHLEVTIGGVSRKVTQIAFAESVNATVYGTGVYASRGTNPTSNTSDNIFSDSLASELVTPTGDPANGYAATFQVGVVV